MSMTRKSYTETAEYVNTIREQLKDDETAQGAVQELAEHLAGMFKRDNGSFSYTRFFAACGLPVPSRFAGVR
jgi:hypothetical protein